MAFGKVTKKFKKKEQNKLKRLESLEHQMGFISGPVLTALCHHWDQQCLAGNQEKLAASKLVATKNSSLDLQCEKHTAYPFGNHLLSFREEVEELDSFQYPVADNGKPLHWDKEVFMSKEPLDEIEVVFYTNAPRLKRGSECTISEEDINIDGCIITKGKVDDLQKSLGIIHHNLDHQVQVQVTC